MHSLSRPGLVVAGLFLIAMAMSLALPLPAGAAPDAASPTRVVESRTETKRSLMGGFWRQSEVTIEQRTIGLDDVQTGSLLLRPVESSDYIEAPRLDTDVDINVTGLLARVVLTQSFANPTDDWVEGVFAFPLPEGAAVDELRMMVGERVIHGQIMEKDQARNTYERAKREGNRASLVAQDRPNLFRTEVANIAPRDTVQVEISYLQTLRYDGGRISLRFPLTITPRYSPDSLSAGMLPAVSALSASTTPALPPVEPALSASSLARISVSLNAGFGLRSVTSASHELDVTRDGRRHEIVLRDVAVPMDRDFLLEWAPDIGAAPGAAVFTEQRGGETYALIMFLPPQEQIESSRLPRETIIVIDTSGSMAGASFDQARESVALALEMLGEGDYFNLIAFSNGVNSLFGDARPASAANLAQARRYLSRLRADGGTNMAPALSSALDAQTGSGLLRQVVFITDGAVSNERELFGLIERDLGETRLFTVGIGSAPNSFFMRQAAQSGRGTYSYIGSVREVGEKMTALFRKLQSPVLKNLRVTWPGTAPEVWPQRTPDLYQSEPLMLAARLADLPDALMIEGEQAETRWQTELPLTRAEDFRGVSTLWARRKVASLMDGLSRGEAADVVRGQVLPLALEHKLVTRFTSLVAVEERPSRPANATVQTRRIANLAPAGGQVSYPRTAAGWWLQMLMGIAWLSCAFLLSRVRRAL